MYQLLHITVASEQIKIAQIVVSMSSLFLWSILALTPPIQVSDSVMTAIILLYLSVVPYFLSRTTQHNNDTLHKTVTVWR